VASRVVPEGGWSHRLKPVRTPAVKKQSHIDFIKRLPCVACVASTGDTSAQCVDPMHLRTGSLLHGKDSTGGQQKPDDRWALPGCRKHHDLQHSMNEMNFWRLYGVDPHLLALVLWGLSGDDHAAVKVILLHVREGSR
jgi:hypothetical protein